jgi:hypothetical protein
MAIEVVSDDRLCERLGGVDFQMRRRIFLGGTLGLTAWPSIVFASRAVSGPIDERADLLVKGLLPRLSKRRSAAVLGRIYLEERRSSTDIAQLIEDLTGSLGMSPSQLKTAEPEDLRALLRVRTSDDFDAARTVRLRGWVLGETETKLFVLASYRSSTIS